MPKRIENLRETILCSAKTELLACGYDALNIRGVAKACGIAVGTLYNYFPSKDMLAAAVMLEDWLLALERMRSTCRTLRNVPEALRTLHAGIMDFTGIYSPIWAGYTFSDSARSAFGKGHRLLVQQLADCLEPVLKRCGADTIEGMAVFLSENLLICTGDSALCFDSFLCIARRILP